MSEARLPRLYAIVDAGCLGDTAHVTAFARELAGAGVTILQYRNKGGDARRMLADGRELRAAIGAHARMIMNDRADLCLATGFDGVHVGQDDLSVEAARTVVGERLWVGVSTHDLEQLSAADAGTANYVAFGPVFATGTKQNPSPVVGVEGLKAAREATSKPLVAIGGITRQNCKAVLDAGADSVAVISDLLREPGRAAEEFLRILN